MLTKKKPWLVIGTWGFTRRGVRLAAPRLARGGSALDAVELVVRLVEADPSVRSVGFGGFPNWEGLVELDAAIMDGRDLSMGAVIAVKGFLHPITAARKLMTDSPFKVLAGDGAMKFCRKHAMEQGNLLTKKREREYHRKIASIRAGKSLLREHLVRSHDTVGVIAMDINGNIACGTSTSGLTLKYPGRVGASPLVGSGFYADNDIGAAVATGFGEDIMKGCPAFRAVDLMRRGYAPQKAARTVMKDLARRLARHQRYTGKMAIICADKQCRYGGAANHPRFKYAVASSAVDPKIVAVKP